MGGPQSRSGRPGEEQNSFFFSLSEIEPRFLGYSDPSLDTIETELFPRNVYLLTYGLFTDDVGTTVYIALNNDVESNPGLS